MDQQYPDVNVTKTDWIIAMTLVPFALIINIYIFLRYLTQQRHIEQHNMPSSSSSSKLVTFWIYYGFIMCILSPLFAITTDIIPICQYTLRISATMPLKSCHTFYQISLLQYCFPGNTVGYSPSIFYLLYTLGFALQITQWVLVDIGLEVIQNQYMCYPRLAPIASIVVFIWIAVFIWDIVILYLYFRKICQITIHVDNHIQKYQEQVRFEKISHVLQKIMTLAFISDGIIFIITMFVIAGILSQSLLLTKILGIYHVPTIVESIIVSCTVYSMATEDDAIYKHIKKCKKINFLEAYRKKRMMKVMKEAHSNSVRLDAQKSNGSSERAQSTETKTEDLFEICGVNNQSQTNNKINCTSMDTKDISMDVGSEQSRYLDSE